MNFLPVEATLNAQHHVIRRATASDADAFALADAEMISQTYRYTMPDEFTQTLFDEIPDTTERLRQLFSTSLATEQAGSEPAQRTWIAWNGPAITGIVSSRAHPQEWESEIELEPLPGVTYQLNHLYTREHTHGSGLAQRLLDVALPDQLPAYLWLVGGNTRAERFYRRNGFVCDPVSYECGPSWFRRPLHRMYRQAPTQ